MHYEGMYLGSNVTAFSKSDSCRVFEMKNDTGMGTMTLYEVFPGIALSYNDFHMNNCYSEFHSDKDTLFIEHCREGRIEWDMENNTCLYLGAGDLRIDNHRDHNGRFEFPLKHYYGISILICKEEAEKTLKDALGGFPFKLAKLQEKFCNRETSFVLRAQPGIEHIFYELYNVPSTIKGYYFKVKVLELLLYLSVLDVSGKLDKHPYFYKVQVEKVKAIEKLMTENIQVHYTLEELSKKFDMSLTSMKICFKGVFGESIYAYMRNFRMNKAAELIRQSTKSIDFIAGVVGYESHSKFSAAFKKVIGKSPLQYRKSIV
ncbi:helix-turn-helix domain-containing protein [Clostridium neuense]|uniref:Helix-turn-helix domain-containing protein n=1 Tax=Clostridium neuense TaxID=1728934 RepID=A0ABW8THF3_9CLOT